MASSSRVAAAALIRAAGIGCACAVIAGVALGALQDHALAKILPDLAQTAKEWIGLVVLSIAALTTSLITLFAVRSPGVDERLGTPDAFTSSNPSLHRLYRGVAVAGLVMLIFAFASSQASVFFLHPRGGAQARFMTTNDIWRESLEGHLPVVSAIMLGTPLVLTIAIGGIRLMVSSAFVSAAPAFRRIRVRVPWAGALLLIASLAVLFSIVSLAARLRSEAKMVVTIVFPLGRAYVDLPRGTPVVVGVATVGKVVGNEYVEPGNQLIGTKVFIEIDRAVFDRSLDTNTFAVARPPLFGIGSPKIELVAQRGLTARVTDPSSTADLRTLTIGGIVDTSSPDVQIAQNVADLTGNLRAATAEPQQAFYRDVIAQINASLREVSNGGALKFWRDPTKPPPPQTTQAAERTDRSSQPARR